MEQVEELKGRVKALIVRQLKLEIESGVHQGRRTPLRGRPQRARARLDRRAGARPRHREGVRHQGPGRGGGGQGLRLRERPLRVRRVEGRVNPVREDLPHAYPFRFVERTVEKRGPAEGRVRALVTGNGRRTEAGGFLPPLTLVEVVAQSALLLEGGDPGIGRSGFLAGVSDFTFDRTPESGDLLNVDVQDRRGPRPDRAGSRERSRTPRGGASAPGPSPSEKGVAA